MRIGSWFIGATVFGFFLGADLLATHLMLPPARLSSEITQEIYRALVTKWFVAGFLLGMGLMFCMIEGWVWRNWRSWNKFCCDHHERVYRSAMGLKK